nr:MAG TPA: Intron-binding protein aquarius N-terminus [Bacteriophage sp.]
MVALNSAFGDISGYEEFANQLANGSMTAEQFKEGIEQLVSTYYTEKVALEGVTDENKAQLEMMLRSLGITNASQVANASLAKEIYAQGNAAIAAGEDSSKYEAALKEMGYGAIFADKATYELKLQMIAANETNMSFDEQIAAIEALGNKAIESGYKIKFMINSANAASKVENLARALQRTGLSAEEAYNQAQQSILNSMQSEFEKGLKDYEFKMPDIDLGGYGSGSGGGGGGGSSSKEEDYEATIDKYEKKTKAIEELEREISNLNNEVSDTESLLEKNELLEKTNKLLEQEKELQLDLNNARDKEIAQNVQQLKSIGFDIEYDPEQDKLLINNKEHINDLTAAGEKTTSEYRKEIEQTIKDTESLNDSNQDAADKFKELNRQIEKNNKAIKENAYNDFKNQQDDILFNTIFYENLESGTSKVREIYLEVFNN